MLHRMQAFMLCLLGILSLFNYCDAGLNNWTSKGPYGGTIEEILVDPNSAQRIYVQSWDRGRILKSTDQAATWKPVNNGEWTYGTLGDVLIDAVNPDILYAASSHGLYRSTDIGETWTLWTLPGERIRTFTQDQTAPDTFYASTGASSLYKTTDAGISWLPSNEGLSSTIKVAVDPFQGSIIYASVYANPGYGLYKSTDGGAHWFDSSNGLGTTVEVVKIVFDPLNHSTVYLLTCDGLFKTTDEGDQWKQLSSDNSCPPYFHSLAIATTNPNILFLADRVFKKSTDGGESWSKVPGPGSSIIVVSVAIDPENSERVYAGTTQGFFVSSDGGKTWRSSNKGLTAVKFYDLELVSGEQHGLYATTSTFGLMKTKDSGDQWSRIDTETDVFEIALDASSKKTLYGIYGGLKRSTNGGTTWMKLRKGAKNFQIDPLRPETIYTFEKDSSTHKAALYRSADGGRHWSKIKVFDEYSITAMAIDPTDNQILYVATNLEPDPCCSQKYLYKTSDGGLNWQMILSRTCGYVWNDCFYNSITIDPRDHEKIFLTGDNGVLRSLDGGLNWDGPSVDFPEMDSLALDPGDANTLFAGGSGVFKSTDCGLSWEDLSTGMRGVLVSRILVDPFTPSVVYAGTEGSFYTMEQIPNCLFCDDFEDGDVSDWNFDSEPWSTSDGDLIADSKQDSLAIAPVSFTGCGECTVTALMELSAPTIDTRGTFSLIGWYENKDKYVELEMNAAQNQWTLTQYSGGSAIAEKSFQFKIKRTVTYRTALSFSGTDFTLTVDGNQLGTMTAGTTPSGIVGMKIRRAAGRLKQIAVR